MIVAGQGAGAVATTARGGLPRRPGGGAGSINSTAPAACAAAAVAWAGARDHDVDAHVRPAWMRARVAEAPGSGRAAIVML